MEAVASQDQNRKPVSSRKMSEHSCLQHGLLVSFRESTPSREHRWPGHSEQEEVGAILRSRRKSWVRGSLFYLQGGSFTTAALSGTSLLAFMLRAIRAQYAAARSAGSLLTFSSRPRSGGELAARAVNGPLAQINAQNILHR